MNRFSAVTAISEQPGASVIAPVGARKTERRQGVASEPLNLAPRWPRVVFASPSGAAAFEDARNQGCNV
jgi:hypothetical protein